MDRATAFPAPTGERIRQLVLSAALALTLPGGAQGATDLYSNVDAWIGNPGFSIVDNSVSGFPLAPPDDEVARDATLGPINVASAGVARLSGSALAIGGLWMGESEVGVSSIRSTDAGGQTRFADEITVESSSLADGTPVQIGFSFHVENVASADHSRPTSSATDNQSVVDLLFSAHIKSGFSGVNDIYIDGADHRRRLDTNFSGPRILVGVLDPLTPRLDVVFDAVVGETFDLIISVDARLDGAVTSSGKGSAVPETGQGSGALAVAFGATPLAAGVTLDSVLFGGDFPAADRATADNALAALALTPVPVPALSWPIFRSGFE